MFDSVKRVFETTCVREQEMPFFGTTSRTPQVTEHLCDNRVTRSYKAQKDNIMNSITCCFQQVILWSTAIWPLLKSRHRRFLIFQDNHAKLSDKGPAGPKNLTQISKNIQSDAKACRVRLEEKMSKCWTKEIGPGVDGWNRRRVFMRVLWRLTIGHEPTLGQGNPFWIKAGLIYGMKNFEHDWWLTNERNDAGAVGTRLAARFWVHSKRWTSMAKQTIEKRELKDNTNGLCHRVVATRV